MKQFFLLFLLIVMSGTFLSGCARKDSLSDAVRDKQDDTVIQDNYSGYGYHPDTEVPEGKGILSEESGEFIIFRR